MAPRKKAESVETAAKATTIEALFNDRQHRQYFQDVYIDTITKTIFQFERAVPMKFPVLKEIAVELVDGAYLTGGCFRSMIRKATPRNYDFMFRDEKAFATMVKRIHNAPEGSFFHGYESPKSVNDFIGSFDEAVLEFTHPKKPPLQLIRSRWFRDAQKILMACDINTSMFVLSSDFTVTYSNTALTDCKNNHVRLNNVSFEVGTGARLERVLNQEGQRLQQNNGFGSYERDHFMRVYQAARQKNPTAANMLFARG